jgi:hypothetical protein
MEFTAKNDGRITETAWISISKEVLLVDGVMYTNDISNKSGVQLLTNKQAVKTLDIDAIFSFIDFNIEGNLERKQKAEKYEVLVPKYIPIKYLGDMDG